MNITREGVFEPFEIFPGVVVPPGTYDHSEAQIAGNTNLGAHHQLQRQQHHRWALRWRPGHHYAVGRGQGR